MAGTNPSVVVVTLICFVMLARESHSIHCPSGQFAHSLPNGIVRCCIPWPHTCPINYPYTICDADGGWDDCKKCPPGSIQPNLSNSTNPKSCFKNRPICSEEKVPLNRMEMLKDVRPLCVCDRAENYFPIMDGIGCDFKPRGCSEGTELQVNGTCGPCLLGTYKDWSGYGLCKPWTNCGSKGLSLKQNGTASTDSKCEKRRTIFRVIPKGILSALPMNTTSGPTTVMHAGKSRLPDEFGLAHITLLAVVFPVNLIGVTALVFFIVRQAANNSTSGQKKARVPDIVETEACVPLQHDSPTKSHLGVG